MSADRLHLVRHGEVHNPRRVLYGRLPGYALSPGGRRMARQAAEYVLSIGGAVRVNGEDREIRDAAGLPAEAYTLTGVFLERNKGVTDEGLAHFKKCKGLFQIDLRNTGATNAGLLLFKGCKSLSEVDVRGTRVTAAGVAEFNKARPRCTVRHDPDAPPKK